MVMLMAEERLDASQWSEKSPSCLLSSLKGLQHSLEAAEDDNSRLWLELQNGQTNVADSTDDMLLKTKVESIAHLRDVLHTFSDDLSHFVTIVHALDSRDVDTLLQERTKLSRLCDVWRSDDIDSSGYSSKHSHSDEATCFCRDYVNNDKQSSSRNDRQSSRNSLTKLSETFSVAIQTDPHPSDQIDHEQNSVTLLDVKRSDHCGQPCLNGSHGENPINNLPKEQLCRSPESSSCGCLQETLDCVRAEDFRLVCENNKELQTEVRTSRLFIESLIERLKGYHFEAENKLSSLELGMKTSKHKNPVVIYSDCSSQSSDIHSDYPSSQDGGFGRNIRNANSLLAPRERSLSSLSIDSMSILKGKDFRSKKLELLNRNKALKNEIDALKDDSSTGDSEMSTLSVPTLSIASDTKESVGKNQSDMLERMVAKHVEDYLKTRRTSDTTHSSMPIVSSTSPRRKRNSNGPSPFRTINVSSWGGRKSR